MEPSDAQIATLRPWIHPVRWLWRALRYFWATIFVSLLLGTLSGVFLLAKGTDLRTLIALNWLGQHLTLSLVAFLLFIALTVLIWLTVSRFATAPAQHSATPLSLFRRNREALVHMLRQEYGRRMTHSLQGAAIMALGLRERTDVTRSSAQLVFYRSKTVEPRPLPPSTSIIQAYDQAGHAHPRRAGRGENYTFTRPGS